MAEAIRAKLISQSPSRKGQRAPRAEVTTVFGGRTMTCHLRKEKGRWSGHNPDKAAIRKLDAAEAKLGSAERQLANAEARHDAKEKSEADGKDSSIKTSLGDLKIEVETAKAERILAQQAVAAIEAVTPRFPEFKF